MALIHAFLVITLRANQIVSGLALTIFAGALGLSAYLGNDLNLSGFPADHAFTPIDVFGLGDVPVLGPIVFDSRRSCTSRGRASSLSVSISPGRGPA